MCCRDWDVKGIKDVEGNTCVVGLEEFLVNPSFHFNVHARRPECLDICCYLY